MQPNSIHIYRIPVHVDGQHTFQRHRHDRPARVHRFQLLRRRQGARLALHALFIHPDKRLHWRLGKGDAGSRKGGGVEMRHMRPTKVVNPAACLAGERSAADAALEAAKVPHVATLGLNVIVLSSVFACACAWVFVWVFVCVFVEMVSIVTIKTKLQQHRKKKTKQNESLTQPRVMRDTIIATTTTHHDHHREPE